MKKSIKIRAVVTMTVDVRINKNPRYNKLLSDKHYCAYFPQRVSNYRNVKIWDIEETGIE